MADSEVLFTNVRILDGSGASPYAGSVLVQGNRIRASAAQRAAFAPAGAHRDRRRRRDADARHVRGPHALLVERRGRRSPASRRCRSRSTCCGARKVAKRYLEAGWTSCVGAACAKPRLDVVDPQRDQLGPDSRARAISPPARRSRCPAGSATRHCRTCRSPSSASASTSAAPTRCARRCACSCKYGVDSIKLNLSGDNFVPARAGRHHVDDRRGGGGRDAKRRACAASAVAAHARSADSVKQALRHGMRGDLPRELHRQRNARPARGAQGPDLRRARHRDPLRDAARGRALGHHATPRRARWATRTSGTRRSSR